MRDGQPAVCPSLQSVSLRWENEDTAYLSMSILFFTAHFRYHFCEDVTVLITFCTMYVGLNIVFYSVQFLQMIFLCIVEIFFFPLIDYMQKQQNI